MNNYSINLYELIIKHTLSSQYSDECAPLLPRKFTLAENESVSISAITGDVIYLLQGEISIAVPESTQKDKTLTCDDQTSLYPITSNASVIQIRAERQSTFYHLNPEMLDNILTWEQMIKSHPPSTSRGYQYIASLINTKLFKELPQENLVEAALYMKEIHAKPGEVIVKQDDDGDAFYFILEGDATVSQIHPIDETEGVINKLRTGDSFGEESLVMEGKRTATVTMDCDSILLKMDKEDYKRLFSSRLIDEITPQTAKELINDGHIILDVRFEEEKELYGFIADSELIPLNDIRHHIKRLASYKKPFVIYCRSGKRSKAAAVVLREHGIMAKTIAGGIKDWPYEIEHV